MPRCQPGGHLHGGHRSSGQCRRLTSLRTSPLTLHLTSPTPHLTSPRTSPLTSPTPHLTPHLTSHLTSHLTAQLSPPSYTDPPRSAAITPHTKSPLSPPVLQTAMRSPHSLPMAAEQIRPSRCPTRRHCWASALCSQCRACFGPVGSRKMSLSAPRMGKHVMVLRCTGSRW